MKKEYENDFEFISSYFNLELTDKEMLLFEKKVKGDVSFAEKVSTYKESIKIVDGIDPNSEENARQTEWRNIIKKTKQIKVFQLKRIVGVAASLIIAFSLIFYFSLEKADTKVLVQDAWNKKVGLDFVLRSNTSDTTQLVLSKVLSLYENKQYNEILIQLKSYNPSSNSYKDILLLRALAYHKLDQSESAIKILDTLISFSPDISRWYKGLIYLDNKNIETAKLYVIIPKNSEEGIKLKK